MAGSVDRNRFIALLTERFPEIAAEIDDCSKGLLHLEMATLGRATQAAIDSQDEEVVRRHFRFIDEVFRDASPDVENAVNVSYLEHLRFRRAQGRPDQGSGTAPPSTQAGVDRPGGSPCQDLRGEPACLTRRCNVR
jgi:hypothetical protein